MELNDEWSFPVKQKSKSKDSWPYLKDAKQTSPLARGRVNSADTNTQ